MSFLHLLFSFQGRIGRGKFWLGIWLVISFCVAALLLVLRIEKPDTPSPALLLPLVVNFMLAALMVKRFHDRGKSGWWSIVAAIPPILFGATGGQPDRFIQGAIAALAVGVGFWLLFELGVSRGQQSSNRFGAAPSQPARATRAVALGRTTSTILSHTKPIAPQFNLFSGSTNIIGDPRTTIAAVAIVVASFLFIHEYQPGYSIITNMIVGDICLTNKVITPLDAGENIFDKLLRENSNKAPDESVIECGLAIPYRWVLAFVVGVIAVNCMARLRR